MDNTNRFMTESIEIGGGSRADLGDWKKFCLNLTNIAVPSLIANDLVIVHPMTSFSGSVAYLKYVAGTPKGDVKGGEDFNGVFGLGQMTDARVAYASELVVEKVESGVPTLTPVVEGLVHGDEKHTYKCVKADGTIVYDNTIVAGTVKVAYRSAEFAIEKHPDDNKIASIKPILTKIALVCEPRRIAVKYDQITAFQAKTDYGFSLDKQIAEQACGELAY